MKANKAEWQHDLQEILKSTRIAEMTFHVPKVDKDKEIISAEAMSEALEDYRHFPIISEFHKERPVGVAEKIWQTQSDEFKALIRIREDPSVDDVWDKMNLPEGAIGRYDQVSIAGRRTKFSPECSLHQSQRSAKNPCRTSGLRLDSISICDDAARNTSTSLNVVKASTEDPELFVYTSKIELRQVKDTLIKAETTNSSLIHPVTDGTLKKPEKKVENGVCMKKCNKPPVEKADEKESAEEKKEEEEEKEEKAVPEGESEAEEETRAEDEKEQSVKKKKVVKAPPEEKEPAEKEKDETEETKKADSLESKVDRLTAIIEKLVSSDKQVHTEMKKADEVTPASVPDVVKAEVPVPVIPAVSPEIQKAEMEQDFKKALDAAIAPLTAELTTLKKANEDLAAKLESYAAETIQKSGIYMLNVDRNGTPRLTNAGAVALQTEGQVKQ